ncbi:MAG: hypothetical protein OXR66_07685 [Candidatus Woesearchaeota archaeon]|nr:hypothetical protein [Candidatus Woesearchaeota archaeon]
MFEFLDWYKYLSVAKTIFENWKLVVIVALVVFIVLVFLFRRYIGALIYDYVVDFGISHADNLILVGLIGVDAGDFTAAAIILVGVFIHERKIVGLGPALGMAGMAAWEASNFFPLGTIPVFGEVAEGFFNLFPYVFLSRIMSHTLFSKKGDAERAVKELQFDMNAAQQFQIDAGDAFKMFERAKALIEKENYVDAIKFAKKTDSMISSAIREQIQSNADVVNETINQLSQLEGTDDALAVIDESVQVAQELLQDAFAQIDRREYQIALQDINKAKQIVQQAAAQFDEINAQDLNTTYE